MRVLVTGGAGFVGSHLVELLMSQSYQVYVLDNLSTGAIKNVPPGVSFVKADVRQPLDGIFNAVRPSVVVHLAAQVSVPQSVTRPNDDLGVNVGGTINVMMAAAQSDVQKVISLSSAAVYGMPQGLPLTDDTPTAPLSPYGLSKLSGESYVRLLAGTYGIRHTVIRPANIFGPRQLTQGDGAVIPAFLMSFLKGEDPVIQGDGMQSRDFVYVTDMARAVRAAFDRADGFTLNVGTGRGVTVKEIWAALAVLTGWNRSPVHGPARMGDIRHSVMDYDGALNQLQWAPQVSLGDGLEQTVAWYLRHHRRQRADAKVRLSR